MAHLALINNFDDAQGGPSKRTGRFQKWFSDLDVIGRDQLGSADMRRRLYETYDGFVLSGSPHNVTDIDLPQEAWMKDQVRFIRDCPKPVLGTCFGHQILCHAFGATVAFIQPDEPRKNNATALLRLEIPNALLPGQKAGAVVTVEESHNQEVVAGTLPAELENVASPERGWQKAHSGLKESAIQLVGHKSRPVFGTQFHPETFDGVTADVEKTGAELLRNFEALCAKPVDGKN